MFDVGIMLVFAIGGFFLNKLDFSLSAIILGMILGPIAESGFAQALTISGGGYGIFFASVPAKILWVIIIVLLVQPLIGHYRSKKIKNTAS
jgi:putative tricarboxylic transport membrane protein